MKTIFTLIFKISLLICIMLPLSSHAQNAIIFSDLSGGVFRFQLKLAEQGSPEAQYKVGEMFEQGQGVAKDNKTAKTWFQKAARQGHKKSGYKLLYIDIKTYGLNDVSKPKLAKLRQESASGNPNAQYFLGKLYAGGVGVPKSLDNALTWLKKAAFNGVTEAEHEAIAIEEQLARLKEKEASKKAIAAAAAKKRKAEDARLKEQKRKADKARAANQKAAKRKQQEESVKRKSGKKAENRKAAADRKRLEDERKAIADEKAQLEKEKRAIAAEKARKAERLKKPAITKSNSAKSKDKSTFQSDPCKGKSARFLSTCR